MCQGIGRIAQDTVNGAVGFGIAGMIVAMAALVFASGAVKWKSSTK